MNLDELRDVQDRERATDSLQELPDSFYEDVADYIADLKAERDEAADAAEDPFADPDVNRLTDEIQTAEQVAEAIYERRVGKIVKQASFAAADMPGDEGGLTGEERDLYDDLVGRITDNKQRVLDVLAGESPDGPDGEAASETDAEPDVDTDAARGLEDPAPPAEDGVDAADLMGDGREEAEGRAADPTPAEPGVGEDSRVSDADRDGDAGGARVGAAESGASGADADDESDGGTERTTVQITRDVGEVFGVDERTYTLESDDVVTLPAENARPLVERDAAEPLE
ncbi:MAG: hypothetical protein ABEJ04_07390 [Halobacteriaceae archaeon]